MDNDIRIYAKGAAFENGVFDLRSLEVLLTSYRSILDRLVAVQLGHRQLNDRIKKQLNYDVKINEGSIELLLDFVFEHKEVVAVLAQDGGYQLSNGMFGIKSMDASFLIITLIIAILIWILDYIIPAMGTKKFGGTKYGMVGTTLGLIVGLLSPIPGGIIIGPFVGALIGELANNADSKTALKAAFGSFIGFIASAFIKFIVAVIYFGFFFKILWDYKTVVFML